LGTLLILASTSNEYFGSIERITSSEDTRSVVWSGLLKAFWSEPLTGMANESAMGESSYLSVAAGFGLLGLVPFGYTVARMVMAIVGSVRRRKLLGTYGGMADVIASGMGALLCLWTFEAYALGTIVDVMIGFFALIAMHAAVRSQLAFAQNEHRVLQAEDADPAHEQLAQAAPQQ
jgi:hypothetical protein